MSDLTESIKAIEELRSKLVGVNFPRINTDILREMTIPQIDIPNINKEIKNFKNPLVELAKEQNNSLKALVKYNEDISRYNEKLVSLNEKILNKINSLDDTLTFLNEAFSNKAKKDNKNSEQQLSLLLQLITIIESRDSSKLETFMSNIGAPLAVGLLVEALKIKFGLN
ncbi:MAG: hypothetical protein ACI33I_08145 [Clostridium sp.]